MSESDRRHARYQVHEGAMLSQDIRTLGLLGKLVGWSSCRIKDLSLAGAMVLTERKIAVGGQVEIMLVGKSGQRIILPGKVANVGRDERLGKYKLGVCLHVPDKKSNEWKFLQSLPELFQPSR